MGRFMAASCVLARHPQLLSPRRGEGSRTVGYLNPPRGEGGGSWRILAGAARHPKKFRHPLGYRPSIVYNRTNTDRRETGEFLDKLVAEVRGGVGTGARGGIWGFET